MATLISDKGNQGQSWVFETTDTPIMTWNQVQGSSPNASEVNGTTIAPVPVGKQLVITNCTKCLQPVQQTSQVFRFRLGAVPQLEIRN